MVMALPVQASGAYLRWAKTHVTYRYAGDTKDGWYAFNTVLDSYETFAECKAALDKSLAFRRMVADWRKTQAADPSTWPKDQQESWARSQDEYRKSAGYRMKGEFKSFLVVGTMEIRFWERGSEQTEHICLPDTITFPAREEGVPSSR